jgi:hypothetical protein
MRLYHTLFPTAYVLIWLSAVAFGTTEIRVATVLCACIFALYSNSSIFLRISRLAVPALAVFLTFSLIVQMAILTATHSLPFDTLMILAFAGSTSSLLLAGTLFSVSSMIAAAEWRGSLLRTVNGFGLPRDVRIICALAGAFLGDFTRVIEKVHFAAAARGDAAPKFSPRNLAALPPMAADVWTVVFTSIATRLSHQWSSDAFWERYVPTTPSMNLRQPHLDWAVTAVGLVLLLVALAISYQWV